MKKNSGFSLIELMIVVAIIAIVGAIAMPSYDSYMKKGRRADAKVGLLKVADKQERYYLQNNTYAANTALLGLTDPWISDEGYYSIAVDTGADASGFTLTATAQGAQSDDTDCETMSLSSTGAETATAGSGGNADRCW
jgi:type IV pilus assembly protein PilE